MTGVGLEVLLEDLIPEIALSGDKGTLHPPSRTTNRCGSLALTLTLAFTFTLTSLLLEAAPGDDQLDNRQGQDMTGDDADRVQLQECR